MRIDPSKVKRFRRAIRPDEEGGKRNTRQWNLYARATNMYRVAFLLTQPRHPSRVGELAWRMPLLSDVQRVLIDEYLDPTATRGSK